MRPSDVDPDARLLAFLTKTRYIRNVDVAAVAQRTGLTQRLVETTLYRLQTAGRVRLDAEGRWTLA